MTNKTNDRFKTAQQGAQTEERTIECPDRQHWKNGTQCLHDTDEQWQNNMQISKCAEGNVQNEF